MLNAKNIEDIKSIEKSRNIVSEIVNFGVTNKEIIKIIELLSLELEDTNLMREIHSFLKPNEETSEIRKENLII